jgi:hypothetical protein
MFGVTPGLQHSIAQRMCPPLKEALLERVKRGSREAAKHPRSIPKGV